MSSNLDKNHSTKFSLRRRIILSMALALLIPIAISSWLSMNDQKKRMIAQHQSYQASILQLTMNGIMLFMNENHPEEIQNSLKGLQNQTAIKSIQILSENGTIKFSTKPEEVGRRIPRWDQELWSRDTVNIKVYEDINYQTQTMTLVTRIAKEQRCYECHTEATNHIGFLSISDDISNINVELNIHTRNYILLATGIIIFLFITIFVIHLRFVQRNLKLLSSAITDVEKGNFRSHIPADDSEEIGTLIRSFNQMIDRLNVMREELRVAHLRELERADKLASVGQLAASMAHEIKNPVTGISSAMQVLVEDPDQDEQNIAIFEEISRQILRIDHAVNSLLCFARPREPVMISTSVEMLLNLMLKLVYQQAQLAQVEVKTEFLCDIPEIVVDSEQIEQVFVNLAMNSIQAMPNGGVLTITVSCQPESELISISFKDTGIGIEPDKLSQIFKPFYTSKHKGTGLGLAICRSIITRHGGDIMVESNVGLGTTFTITFPQFARGTGLQRADLNVDNLDDAIPNS